MGPTERPSSAYSSWSLSAWPWSRRQWNSATSARISLRISAVSSVIAGLLADQGRGDFSETVRVLRGVGDIFIPVDDHADRARKQDLACAQWLAGADRG